MNGNVSCNHSPIIGISLIEDVITTILTYCDDITCTILYLTCRSLQQYTVSTLIPKSQFYERVMLRYPNLLEYIRSINCKWTEKLSIAHTIDSDTANQEQCLGIKNDKYVHIARNGNQVRVLTPTIIVTPFGRRMTCHSIRRMAYVWRDRTAPLSLGDAEELELLYLTQLQHQWTGIEGSTTDQHSLLTSIEWRGIIYNVTGYDNHTIRQVVLDCGNANVLIREYLNEAIDYFRSPHMKNDVYDIQQSLLDHSSYLSVVVLTLTSEDGYRYLTDYGSLPDRKEVIVDIS